jgi:hypothetical protein
MLWTGVEHQHRANARVVGKHSKQSPLVVVIEMKETVPRQSGGCKPIAAYFS